MHIRRYVAQDATFIGAVSFAVLALVLGVMYHEGIIGRSTILIISGVFWTGWYFGRMAARKAWGYNAQ